MEENDGDPDSSETAAEDSSNDIDSNTQSRFYVALDKEQRKNEPNKAVINRYLNLEFESRSCLLENTKRELRVAKILELYPCFKDPVEVCFFQNILLPMLDFKYLCYSSQDGKKSQDVSKNVAAFLNECVLQFCLI